jgi:threonine dehydrogenase-like Zn-dependent dehydrogenase
MKALVTTAHQLFEYAEVPDPMSGDGEVLVRIEAVGICGTDIHSYRHADPRKQFPAIWGHEPAGVIVGGVRDGRRVAINPIQWCGTCEPCLNGRNQLCRSRKVMSLGLTQGAFAEYVVVPDRNAVDVAPGVSSRHAALSEPIAVGHHGVVLGARLLDKPIAAARCLVLGGGAIGLGACLSIRMQAAWSLLLVEPFNERRQLIEDIEQIETADPANLSGRRGAGFDLVIDAVGSGASRKAALESVAIGGVVVHLGLADEGPGYDFRDATLREVALLGAYGYRPTEFREIVDAMGQGRLGSLAWAEAEPLAEGAETLAALASSQKSSLRTLLVP